MTSRFLNVLTLIRQVVPVIALQVEAIRVEQRVLLNFVRVLDEPPPPPDSEPSLALLQEQARHARLTRDLVFSRKPLQPEALAKSAPSLSSTASPAIRPLVRRSRDRERY